MSQKASPPTLHTPGFSHYALAWSLFHPTRLALASAANFGLVGNGRLHVVNTTPTTAAGPLLVEKQYETQDGLYDLAWSEIHENQIVTASGDGSIRLWDVTLNGLPLRAWHEHTREVFSVDWGNIKKDVFCSASWDGNVKIWSPERPRSLMTLHAHHACVYQALFSPHHPDTLATCSTDGTLKIFDLRAPAYVTSASNSAANAFTEPISAAALTVPASQTEILTLDWNKYKPWTIATGGVDRTIRVWDCRMVRLTDTAGVPANSNAGDNMGGMVGGQCEVTLPGHEYAVRKVQWSPHRGDVLASASYDMTCRVWTTTPAPGTTPLRHIHDAHTEFVVGCSWSLYDPSVLASCGWDGRMQVFRV